MRASISHTYKGPVWLNNVDCRSDDEILDDCNNDGWGNYRCGHREDVGVICRSGKLAIHTSSLCLG